MHRQGHARPGPVEPEARQHGRRAGRHVGLPAGLPEGAGQAQRVTGPLSERQYPDDQKETEQRHIVVVVGLKQVKWPDKCAVC